MPNTIHDLRSLQCAIAAAEMGSFRQAAEVLALSESSVSRRIQHLEHRLGFPLFTRSRTGVRTTPAGSAFLTNAVAGANQINTAISEGAAIHRSQDGEIRVGIAPSRTGGMFNLVLTRFKTVCPWVKVLLTEVVASQTTFEVARGTIDVAISFGAQALSCNKTQVLWREAISVAVNESHPLAREHNLTWDDIRDETFILSSAEQGAEIHNCIVARLAEPDRSPSIDMQNISYASVFSLVGTGCGITLADESVVRPTGGLRFIPLAGETDTLIASAIWRKDNANPALPHLIAVAAAIGRGER